MKALEIDAGDGCVAPTPGDDRRRHLPVLPQPVHLRQHGSRRGQPGRRLVRRPLPLRRGPRHGRRRRLRRAARRPPRCLAGRRGPVADVGPRVVADRPSPQAVGHGDLAHGHSRKDMIIGVLTVQDLRGNVKQRRRERTMRGGVPARGDPVDRHQPADPVRPRSAGRSTSCSMIDWDFGLLTDTGWFPRRERFDLRTIFVGSVVMGIVAMLVAVPVRPRHGDLPVRVRPASCAPGGQADHRGARRHPVRRRRVLRPQLGRPRPRQRRSSTSRPAPRPCSPPDSASASSSSRSWRRSPRTPSARSPTRCARRATAAVRARSARCSASSLPAAVSGIVAAMIIAVSRAIGETMVAAMAGGYDGAGPYNGFNPLNPGLSMTAAMTNAAGGTDSTQGGASFEVLFFVGLLLFLITLASTSSATASCSASARSTDWHADTAHRGAAHGADHPRRRRADGARRGRRPADAPGPRPRRAHHAHPAAARCRADDARAVHPAGADRHRRVAGLHRPGRRTSSPRRSARTRRRSASGRGSTDRSSSASASSSSRSRSACRRRSTSRSTPARTTGSPASILVNIRNLAGVPAVIYGVLGLIIFVEWLEPVTQGETVIAAGLTMAVLVLPIVIITSMEAIRAVPAGPARRRLRRRRLALGGHPRPRAALRRAGHPHRHRALDRPGARRGRAADHHRGDHRTAAVDEPRRDGSPRCRC